MASNKNSKEKFRMDYKDCTRASDRHKPKPRHTKTPTIVVPNTTYSERGSE